MSTTFRRARAGLYVPHAGGASGYSATVLADSPLAYWRLDETATGTAADATGNGHSGSYGGTGGNYATTGATSDGNKAFGTGGLGDNHVTIATASWMDITGAFSYEIIINPLSNTSQNNRGLMTRWQNNGGGASNGLMWIDVSGHIATQWVIGGSTKSIASSSALSANTWYRVLFTYDGAHINLYINGSSAATAVAASGSAAVGSCDLVLGSYGVSGFPFAGVIDEAAVYNYALTSTQDAAHQAAL